MFIHLKNEDIAQVYDFQEQLLVITCMTDVKGTL